MLKVGGGKFDNLIILLLKILDGIEGVRSNTSKLLSNFNSIAVNHSQIRANQEMHIDTEAQHVVRAPGLRLSGVQKVEPLRRPVKLHIRLLILIIPEFVDKTNHSEH